MYDTYMIGSQALGKTPHTASDGKLAWFHVRRIAQQQDQNRSAGHSSGVGADAAALRVASGCRCQLLSHGLAALKAIKNLHTTKVGFQKRGFRQEGALVRAFAVDAG